MKSFVKSVFVAGTLLIGVNTVLAGQASNAWQEQWFKAKYGRNTPMEEARQAAERRTSEPEGSMRPRAMSSSNQWHEQWFKAKFGHNTPAEEARLAAARAEQSVAVTAKPSASRNDWFEQWNKAKYGRYSPRQEARRRAPR